MKRFVKTGLRNTVFVFILGLAGSLSFASHAQRPELWVKLPDAKDASGAVRRDVLLVRYRPTGRSAVVGIYGRGKLDARLLLNLGVDPAAELKVSELEFYRIFSTSRRRTVSEAWEKGVESWTANPSTKGLWLAREAMSVMRTRQEAQGTLLELESTTLVLGTISVPDKTVSAEDPEKVKAARRKIALEQLEKFWQQVLEQKYDRSLVGLDALVTKMGGDLNAEELNKASFGRALSRFHQMGCREAGPAFEELQKPGPYLEDSRYYGGLCALDRGDYSVAQERFQALMSQNSTRYQDAARFYLGVAAEAEGDLEAAESAYLDTVDFASDQGIVSLAKDKLALLEDKKAQDRYAKKLVSVLAVGGLGWDSNALSLPASVQPSDYNLDSGSSANYLGLVYIDLKNPLLHRLQNKVHYTFLMLGYLNSQIAPTSDLQSHSVGTSVEWGEELGYRHTVDAKYSLTSLGKLGSNEKFLTSYGASWGLSKGFLDARGSELDRMWNHSLDVSRQTPAQAATSAASDGTAFLFTGTHKLRKFRGVQSYGPGGEWEYKAAKGSDARYFMVGANGSYEQPIGPELWKLKFTQEGALKGTFYFSSSTKRKDYLLTTTSSISRTLSEKFEARAQLVLSKNFSADDYAYNRYQLNVSLSAFF
jgi:tetratricopeptide (TPR) repeat protein